MFTALQCPLPSKFFKIRFCFCFDPISLQMLQSSKHYNESEKKELGNRSLMLLLYLLRSPCYDLYTRSVIIKMETFITVLWPLLKVNYYQVANLHCCAMTSTQGQLLLSRNPPLLCFDLYKRSVTNKWQTYIIVLWPLHKVNYYQVANLHCCAIYDLYTRSVVIK